MWKAVKMMLCTVFYLILLSVLPVSTIADQVNIPISEYTGLKDLYYSTKGKNWIQSGWNFTGIHYPCVEKWSGLTCVSTADNRSLNIQTIVLDSCNLFGQLPDSIGNFSVLKELSIQKNHLTGTAPNTISQLSNLESLYLNGNRLDGPIADIINTQTQTQVLNIDISDNQLTGTIPEVWFTSLSKLQTFSVMSNCISGILPISAMCDATGLKSLTLDGLHSASSCVSRYFPSWSGIDTYSATRPHEVFTEFPSCLFNMTNLVSLQLSGNALSISIPSDLVLSESLKVLSLSHNNLLGTIPKQIQTHVWNSLDLSHNKLSGTLMDGFAITTSEVTENVASVGSKVSYSNKLYAINTSAISGSQQVHSLLLNNNRLSGSIPRTIQQAQSISVLVSNMFSCSASRAELPVHDSKRNVYGCGSDGLNNTIYFWLTLIACCSVILFIVWYVTNEQYKPQFMSQWRYNIINWLGPFGMIRTSIHDGSTSMSVHEFCAFATYIRKITIQSTAFVCVILLPLYVTLSQFYGNYTQQYAWVVTATFLSGMTPSMALFVVFLFVTGVMLYVTLSARYSSDEESTVMDTHYMLISGIILTNIVVMICVHISYVYSTTNYSPVVLQIIQVFVALFIFLWNTGVVSALLNMDQTNNNNSTGVNSDNSVRNWAKSTDRRSGRHPSLAAAAADFYSSTDDSPSSRFIGLSVSIVLFNTIVAPLIATAVTSTECFYGLFHTAPAITVNYPIATCIDVNLLTQQCSSYTLDSAQHEASYLPSFNYSYQCSSAYITTYTPVYIFMFVFITVAVPVLHFILLKITTMERVPYGMRRLATQLLPGLLKRTVDNVDNDYRRHSLVERLLSLFQYRGVFSKDIFVVQCIHNIALMFTVGAVVPPLAVIGLVTHTLCTQLLVGRFICVNQVVSDLDRPKAVVLLTQLDADCIGVMERFTASLWIIGPVAMLFYALLLFDIYGGDVGWSDALWVPVAIILLPLLLYVSYSAVIYLLRYCDGRSGKRYKTLSSDGKYIMREYEHVGGKEDDGMEDGELDVSVIRNLIDSQHQEQQQQRQQQQQQQQQQQREGSEWDDGEF